MHCFNPHAREGRDVLRQIYLAHLECFNPHAREGRDLPAIEKELQGGVSIHTPVKGATV